MELVGDWTFGGWKAGGKQGCMLYATEKVLRNGDSIDAVGQFVGVYNNILNSSKPSYI